MSPPPFQNQTCTQFSPNGFLNTTEIWFSALLLSILLGELCIERFYLGYTGLGIPKLVTAGAFGVWYVIEILLLLFNKMKDSKDQELVKY